MINVKSRKCLHALCLKYPSFNTPGDVLGIYCSSQSISNYTIAPPFFFVFFEMAQNLELKCLLVGTRSTFGAGVPTKTHLESRIKKFKPI